MMPLPAGNSFMASKIGDIILPNRVKQLLGYGVVEGDYQFDPAGLHKHVRKMKWWAKGEWEDARGKQNGVEDTHRHDPLP